MPFFLWLRFLTGQRLLEQHRRHLGAPGPRRRPRDLALPRRHARDDHGRAGGPAPGPADLAQPGRACGPSGRSGSRRRSTAWTRSTARSWPCGTSSSSPTARPPQVLGLDKSAASKRYARALDPAQGDPATARCSAVTSSEGARAMTRASASSSDRDPIERAGRLVPRPVPRRRAAQRRGVRRPSTPSWPTRSASSCRPWSMLEQDKSAGGPSRPASRRRPGCDGRGPRPRISWATT